MTELVERYVHQVGRYLPPDKRVEIERELRSQIQDQLDDRYGEAPSAAEVASVLAEFGHPYRLATSYSSEQYLIGPNFYPFMIMVIRYGWVLVPSIVIFLSIFEALVSSSPPPLLDLMLGTVLTIIQTVLIFSAVVVMFFAALERSSKASIEESFNPVNLPQIDDPTLVDRYEAAFGVALGVLFGMLFLYFLRVGGLTLRFDLNDPGDVIPVSTLWMMVTSAFPFAMVFLQLLALRRNRWGVTSWFMQTILELIGTVCLYFVLYKPVLEQVIINNPSLADIPLITSLPEILVVLGGVITLIGRGTRLVRLWNYSTSTTTHQSSTI